MLSNQEIAEIQKAVKRTLSNNCIGYNHEIDQKQLLDAIAIAVTEAIRQYDEMKHRR